MLLSFANQSGSSQTVMGHTIQDMAAYQIPSVDLKSWCADLTARVLLVTGLCQMQDANSNVIAASDAQALFRAILNNEVGTS